MTAQNPALVASHSPSTLSRLAILGYGVVSYAVGVTGLVWLIAASLDLVPFTGGGLSFATPGTALAFNLSMVLLFGLQHAVMARPAFKERWTRVVPNSIERSTFVLVTGVIVSSMMFFWQPFEGLAWAVQNDALFVGLRVLGVLGWAYLFAASFAINHFELFGLQQVWRHFTGRPAPRVPFVQRLMYRFDRHPIMTGMLVGLWCTPVMTTSHLLLAAALTTYIAIGVTIEERTLVALHGDDYRAYRRAVPALVPLPGRGN